jgi:hypothetical protein
MFLSVNGMGAGPVGGGAAWKFAAYHMILVDVSSDFD